MSSVPMEFFFTNIVQTPKAYGKGRGGDSEVLRNVRTD
jgi:hypothetical protein